MEIEKVKQLNKEWVEHTESVEKAIKDEFIRSWIEEHNINIGDDVLIKDVRFHRKTETSVVYYRKAKLIGFHCHVYLQSHNEDASSFYFHPILMIYDKNNKTLQNKRCSHIEFIIKMDLDLLGKEI